jgi:hypothetical protein
MVHKPRTTSGRLSGVFLLRRIMGLTFEKKEELAFKIFPHPV